jgi:glyoxylase-like metal-dependent hydrolase (beta-lactamase superfamily II)
MTTSARSTALACLLSLSGLATAASPVDRINAEAAKGRVTVETLRGGVSLIDGAGGNIAVLETDAGKLLVDGGIALARPQLDQALSRIGPGQPVYLIDTHWHWDHTDGNEWLHAMGAKIVAHPNTLKHLSESVLVEDWKHTFAPIAAAARPAELVDGARTISYGGETILIETYGPSHTDGDLSVYFTNADVLVTGDTYWNGMYPFIDLAAGGSIDGMIRAAEWNVQRAGNDTLVVPGHGPVARRHELDEYRAMLTGVRAEVARLKANGATLKETIAAKPTRDYDAEWGQFVIDPAFFSSLVYRSLVPSAQ